MIRKSAAIIALLASLVLVAQSVSAVDHVHLQLDEFQSCLACTAYGADDAIDPGPATSLFVRHVHQHTPAAAIPVESPAVTPPARGPPHSR